LEGESECITWLPSPHHNHLLASDECGFLYCFDILKGLEQPLWKIQAHGEPCQTIAVNPVIPGFIATGSPERNSPVKFWDISEGNPNCLYTEPGGELNAVFSLQFSIDDPYYLCVGCQSDKPYVINSFEYDAIKEKYGNQNWVYQDTTITPQDPLHIEQPVENNQNNNNNKNNRRKNKKRIQNNNNN